MGAMIGLIACANSGTLAPRGDVSLAEAQHVVEGGVAVDDETASLGYYGLAAGDLDGDAQMDLAATDFTVGVRVAIAPHYEPFGVATDFAVGVAIADVYATGADEVIVGQRVGGVCDGYYTGPPSVASSQVATVHVVTGGGDGGSSVATLHAVVGECGTSDTGLSRVGDVNHDGIRELAVHLDASAAPPGGIVWLVSTVAGDVHLDDLPVTRLLGTDGWTYGGASLASGDLDGDGSEEIVATTTLHADVANAVIATPPKSGDVSLDPALLPSLVGLPTGMVFASGGDLDGDGLHDVAGAGYDAWVWLGPLKGNTGSGGAVATLRAHPDPESPFYAVAVASDVDGDDVDDLIAGAPGDIGSDVGGAAAVWYGPVIGTRDLVDADARLVGPTSGEQAGSRVLGPGDGNGDRFGDLWVNAVDANGGRGSVYILTGGPQP